MKVWGNIRRARAGVPVREDRERNRDVCDTMFKGIDALTLQAIEAMHGAGHQAMEVSIG